jgi:hypothetical protein
VIPIAFARGRYRSRTPENTNHPPLENNFTITSKPLDGTLAALSSKSNTTNLANLLIAERGITCTLTGEVIHRQTVAVLSYTDHCTEQ